MTNGLADNKDYGCYVIDRRSQGVEESVNDLVSLLLPSDLLSSCCSLIL